MAAGRARLWGALCVAIGLVQVASSVRARGADGSVAYVSAGAAAVFVGLSALGLGGALARARRRGAAPDAMLAAVEAAGELLFVQLVTTTAGVLVAAVALALRLVVGR